MTPLTDTRPEAWIPHRGAMRLIDRVLEAGPEHAVAEADVPDDGPFVRAGGMPAWIGIEYMAQAVSAWAGWRARNVGGAPRIGLLLGSRRYEADVPVFPAGACLRIEVRCELMGANGLGLFDGRILLEGREVARARISVFEPEDPMAVLGGAGAACAAEGAA